MIQNQDASGGVQSSLPPDATAFMDMAKAMQIAAGKDTSGAWWYNPGTHTDKIYWIRGGIQDWMYAAGFEKSSSSPLGPLTASEEEKSKPVTSPLSKTCRVVAVFFWVS